MAVVDIHTGVISSPKFAPLSDAALRLWLHGLCWSKEHLMDGFIPSSMLPTLHPKAKRVVAELLRAWVPGKQPLWREVTGGYQIHDFEDWQELSATVQSRRRSWRDQKRGKVTRSMPDSLPDSTPESTPESNRATVLDSAVESRSGGGCGSGCGLSSPTKEDAGGGPALPRLVPRPSGQRQHPLDEDQTPAPPDLQQRAALWLERFAGLHLTRRGSRYLTKPQRDFEPAVRLVRAYADAEMDALTALYLDASGIGFDDKPRTPGHLAHVAPMLEERLKEVGQWPSAA